MLLQKFHTYKNCTFCKCDSQNLLTLNVLCTKRKIFVFLHIMCILVLNISVSASSIEEAAAPPTSQLPLLITHYSEAVCTLETSSREHTGGPHHDQDTVTASLLHDLGSLHLHNNNRK